MYPLPTRSRWSLLEEGVLPSNLDKEEGIVLFQKYADLYKYAIEYTESDNLNQISGKYIPVDRIQGNVYKPSSTLFDVIDSYSLSKWSYNFNEFDLDERVLSDKVKTCIEYGYVKYNLDKGIWEIKDSIRLRIMALDFRSASFGALLFPFLTVFVLVGLTYVPIDIDPILTVLSFKQFVYAIAGVCLLLCVLIPFTFLKLAQLVLLQSGSKSRRIPML